MLRILIQKEIKESWRTGRMVILVAVFVMIGLISPLLAKYTPELLKMVPELPEEFLAMMPPPSVRDSLDQYVKNSIQFGVLLVILLGMGMVAQEKERGTAAMLLVKPVSRTEVLLSKWLVLLLTLLVGLALGASAAAFYTAVLFEPIPLPGFAWLNLMLFVYFGVYATAALFASTLARTQAQAAAGAFGALALLLVAGSLPRVGDFMPGKLVAWGQSVLEGNPAPQWGALAISVGLVALLLASASYFFRQEEI